LSKENKLHPALGLMIIPFSNLLLVGATNVLVAWTWYKVVTAEGDTMFLGLYLFALILGTLYYLALLRWGVKLAWQSITLDDRRFGQSLALFLLNILPMGLIYFITT
jgi:hypothetical protein